MTSDALGSPRIITNQIGQVVSRHDYQPFGEEVLAGTGGRTTAQGYGENDGVRKQYTGYERDTESGLDYAQARYFSSKHGRFTSVDPLTASANIKNPQTFNRYTYGLNSPYKFTDPLGLAPVQHCWAGICNTYDADERAGEREETQKEGEKDEDKRKRPKPPPPPYLGKFEVEVEAGGEPFTWVAPPPEAMEILEEFGRVAWVPIWDNAVDNDFNQTPESVEVTDIESENTSSTGNNDTTENWWEIGGGFDGRSVNGQGTYGNKNILSMLFNNTAHSRVRMGTSITVSVRRNRHQTLTDAAGTAAQNLTSVSVRLPLKGGGLAQSRKITIKEAGYLVTAYKKVLEQRAKGLIEITK